MARRGFATVGTWCLDRNRFIDRWPPEDRIGVAWGLEQAGGGSASNFALAMRRLDPEMPLSTATLTGRDDAGAFLIGLMEEAAIEHSNVVVQDGTTHVTECFVSQQSGMRTHITDFGLGADMTPDHLAIERLSGRYLHVGLPGVHPAMDRGWNGDANGWVTVLKRGRAAGFLTNLELCTLPHDRQRELVLPCLPHLDLLVVNDAEICALAGMADDEFTAGDRHKCEASARALFERGAMDMIAVHWPEGALAVTRDGGAAFVPGTRIPSSEIKGPNGAGDCFAAGFLYGLHEGWPLADALWMGHAAASCSLRAAGTTEGVMPWRDCLDAAEKWGRR